MDNSLVPFLGSKERVYEVLNRKRGLSLEMIRRLNVGLGIPVELIIGKKAQKQLERAKLGLGRISGYKFRPILQRQPTAT